jgi:hypothetical protein
MLERLEHRYSLDDVYQAPCLSLGNFNIMKGLTSYLTVRSSSGKAS